MLGRVRRSRETWKRLVVEFERSGLAREQFARRRGLNLGNFTFWYYKLRGEARANATSQAIQFVPVRVTTSDTGEGLDVFEARIRQLALRFRVGADLDYVSALLVRLAPPC
jgi:hypothetical protein